MRRRRAPFLPGALTLICALGACVPGDSPMAPDATPRPVAAPAAPGQAKAAPRSAASREMVAYYARIARTLEERGLLRTDVAPRDAPFNARQLAENFVHIALYNEYSQVNGGFVERQSASRLRRWEQPVRIELTFGPTVPMARRAADRASVTAYSGQLARATRHPVAMVPRGGNFHVLVLNEDERREAGPLLRRLMPGIDDNSVRAITSLPSTTFCVVFAFSQGDSPAYSDAVAVIRAEHPDGLRLSCLHEELAQGLGLANDSPRARPSIFNDDEEFALLTRHDELLLQMLYDPRLRPGMTEAEARPIVQTIAAELTGGDS